jgi:hypothetical protein
MTVLLGPTPVFTVTGLVFHHRHAGLVPRRWFRSAADALTAGLRPCAVCRPSISSQET